MKLSDNGSNPPGKISSFKDTGKLCSRVSNNTKPRSKVSCRLPPSILHPIYHYSFKNELGSVRWNGRYFSGVKLQNFQSGSNPVLHKLLCGEFNRKTNSNQSVFTHQIIAVLVFLGLQRFIPIFFSDNFSSCKGNCGFVWLKIFHYLYIHYLKVFKYL